MSVGATQRVNLSDSSANPVNVEQKESQKRKVVVITGASRGIGLASAQYLATQGYVVYGTVRKSSDSKALDAACGKCNNLFKIVVALNDEGEINQAVENILKEHGKIDVLINNAGSVLVGTVESCTVKEQQELFDTNYFGPVRWIQAVLPQMRKLKEGQIINIGSVSAIAPYGPWENYSASKFALRGLSESMSATLSQFNIKVSLVEPATIKVGKGPQNVVGTRSLEEPHPYAGIHKAKDTDETDGADPVDLAKLFQKIIETDSPHVRYQFGPFAEYSAQQVYADPTGDKVTKSNIEYYQSQGLLSAFDGQKMSAKL